MVCIVVPGKTRVSATSRRPRPNSWRGTGPDRPAPETGQRRIELAQVGQTRAEIDLERWIPFPCLPQRNAKRLSNWRAAWISVCGNRMTNSSPPMRAARSLLRRFPIWFAQRLSTLSPIVTTGVIALEIVKSRPAGTTRCHAAWPRQTPRAPQLPMVAVTRPVRASV